MIAGIEAADDQSLVLIEEIENGLHPVATIRLVEYLIEVAERKKVQVIFTTHSNDALRPLPSKAIWVATQDRIFQGKLDVNSLRAITGQIETTAVVFVEDRFAKTWTEAVLRQAQNGLVEHVQVHAMEGDGTAVSMNIYHNSNPAIKIPSACYIDGDSRQKESEVDRIYRLPGQAPESYIFDTMMENWASIGGKLSVALLQKFEDADRVKGILESVRRQTMDPHLLFAHVGEQLGLIPESTVTLAFANMWAQSKPQEVVELMRPIRELVSKVGQPVG